MAQGVRQRVGHCADGKQKRKAGTAGGGGYIELVDNDLERLVYACIQSKKTEER